MHHQGFGMGVGGSQMGVGVGGAPPSMHHHHMSPLLGTSAAAGLGLSSNGMVSSFPRDLNQNQRFAFLYSQVGDQSTLD